MNNWEKLKIISTVISVIVIPVILGVIGNRYTQALKEREIQGKFVELAVNILNQPPTEENRNLRNWATEIIDRYSGVPLSDSTKEDLIKKIPITSLETISGIKFGVSDTLRKIDKIILMDTQTFTAQSTIRVLKQMNLSASYHYLIDKKGEITKLVNERFIAYHTRGHNKNSISIGLIHISENSPMLKRLKKEHEPYTELQIENLINLLAEITLRHDLDVNNIIPNTELLPNKYSDLPKIIDEIRNRVKQKIDEIGG